MSDMMARFGLDTSEFRTGADRLRSDSRALANDVQRVSAQSGAGITRNIVKTFGVFKLAKAEVQLAKDAVKAYADEFDFAKEQVDLVTGAMKEFKMSLGRDLLADWAPTIASIIGGLSEAREAASDFIAAFFSNPLNMGAGAEDVAELKAARKQAEAQEKAFKRTQSFKKSEKDLQEQLLRDSGRTRDADIMAENRRHDAIVENLKKEGMAVGRTAEEAARLQSIEKARHEAALRGIDTKDAERLQKEQDDYMKSLEEGDREHARQQREREDADRDAAQVRADQAGAREAVLFAEAEMEIGIMRAEGKHKEAAIEQKRLELARRILEIERDQNLTVEERNAARARAEELAGREIAAMEAAPEGRVRRDGPSAQFHGAPAALIGQVFGGGAARAQDPVVRKTDEVKRELVAHGKILAEIAKNTASGGVSWQ